MIDGSPRPEGATALRYHGMLHGLPMLTETAVVKSTLLPQHEFTVHPVQRDDEFVRVLANLVLRTHSELTHVY